MEVRQIFRSLTLLFCAYLFVAGLILKDKTTIFSLQGFHADTNPPHWIKGLCSLLFTKSLILLFIYMPGTQSLVICAAAERCGVAGSKTGRQERFLSAGSSC